MAEKLQKSFKNTKKRTFLKFSFILILITIHFSIKNDNFYYWNECTIYLGLFICNRIIKKILYLILCHFCTREVWILLLNNSN